MSDAQLRKYLGLVTPVERLVVRHALKRASVLLSDCCVRSGTWIFRRTGCCCLSFLQGLLDAARWENNVCGHKGMDILSNLARVGAISVCIRYVASLVFVALSISLVAPEVTQFSVTIWYRAVLRGLRSEVFRKFAFLSKLGPASLRKEELTLVSRISQGGYGTVYRGVLDA